MARYRTTVEHARIFQHLRHQEGRQNVAIRRPAGKDLVIF